MKNYEPDKGLVAVKLLKDTKEMPDDIKKLQASEKATLIKIKVQQQFGSEKIKFSNIVSIMGIALFASDLTLLIIFCSDSIHRRYKLRLQQDSPHCPCARTRNRW